MAGSVVKEGFKAKTYAEKNMVGIISTESFQTLRSSLTPEEIDSYSCELTTPSSTYGERKVYVLDLGKNKP
jgi:hypothetical protein